MGDISGFSTPGRPYGYVAEPKPASVCVSIPGSSGSGNRCNVSELEQIDISLHLSASQSSSIGGLLPSSLQGKNYTYSSLVAKSVLVSNPAELVFQPQGVPQSSSISESVRLDDFLQILLSISLMRLDFFNANLWKSLWHGDS